MGNKSGKRTNSHYPKLKGMDINMSNYVIITDSSADLTTEQVDSLGVYIAPLTYYLDDVAYSNYPDHHELPISEFYSKIHAGANVHTSAVNPEGFIDFFRPVLDEGKDILYIGFSSGLSTTYQSANIAAQELLESYPERKIFTVDSLCASLGQGLLVYLTVKQKENGATLEEARDYAEKMKDRIIHEFTVDDLGQLKRGGRISGATALIGGMLSMKPMLHVSDDGHLVKHEKNGTIRGRNASIKALAEKAVNWACDEDETPIFISHGDCKEEAELLAKLVSEKLPKKKIEIGHVGPVIGAHSGYGTLAIFIVCAE